MSCTPSPCAISRWAVGMVGRQRRGQHERDVALAQDVAGLVLDLGLQARVGDHVEAEGVAVEVRRLPGVADEEPHVVDAAVRAIASAGMRVAVLPRSADAARARSASRPSQKAAMASRTSCAALEEPSRSKPGSKKTSSSSSMMWPACWASTRLCQVKKATFSSGMPRRLDAEQAVLQLLPESGGGPVLDGEAGPLGELAVLAAVEPLELVAELERVGPAVLAFAHVVEAQAQGLADGQQPLEVGRAEPEGAAVHRPLGADQLRVAFAVLRSSSTAAGGRPRPVRPAIDDPQLVHEDFLGRPRLPERRGVDHPQQGRDQELVREHRELPDEVGELGVRRLARRGTSGCTRCR